MCQLKSHGIRASCIWLSKVQGWQMEEEATIWTIGHSTRTMDEFVAVLKAYGIETVVDVRTVPRSRKNPQFNKDELERGMPDSGIEYVHAKDLGGLRKPSKESLNAGWQNESFRGFADYMQTPEFTDALARLMELAAEKRAAIMCAELLPWRCHRSLIADALLTRGFEIAEIFDEHKSQPHKLTPFAVVEGEQITYPPEKATGSQG
jgi:uncharacterized protein (DUF488 family)